VKTRKETRDCCRDHSYITQALLGGRGVRKWQVLPNGKFCLFSVKFRYFKMATKFEKKSLTLSLKSKQTPELGEGCPKSLKICLRNIWMGPLATILNPSKKPSKQIVELSRLGCILWNGLFMTSKAIGRLSIFFLLWIFWHNTGKKTLGKSHLIHFLWFVEPLHR
jgi:hypothetical protein